MIHSFVNKYYFYTYYSDIRSLYGSAIVITNKGIFDVYNLSGVNFSEGNTVRMDPSLSLDSNKSIMYCHNNNGIYDIQILFGDKNSHGILLLGGSILIYNNIIWYEE